MVGSDDEVLGEVISLSETHDLKIEGQTGIVTTGFKLLPSKLVDHTCYNAYTEKTVSCKSCSSWIDSF